jgi:hypothetical protein
MLFSLGQSSKTTGTSMILGMSVGAFTLVHVIITLVAIGSGLIVVGGMFSSHRLPVTTALFLLTTGLTSLTGFLFPIHGFTPALGVGIVACAILLVAVRLVQGAPDRCMALDLRDRRCRIALFERVCSGRAELRESIGPQRLGSDSVRAPVRGHTGIRVGDLHSDYRHRCD